jgi:1-acyl-sn-glycerol-3-phosphate acyltransferase
VSLTHAINILPQGTFHIWEQLRAPIIPVISYGAFDLFPGKSWLNSTGSVVVRYLEPIRPEEADSRDKVAHFIGVFRGYDQLSDCR